MPFCPECGSQTSETAKFCRNCGANLQEELPPARAAAPPSESRKVVTIVFCDVTGSTSLGEQRDPESVRRVMSGYFDAMRDVLTRHGGTVEKFIGDAVMSAFGIPVLHEDDAIRAVRAAAEMQETVAQLNEGLERDWGARIQVRIGVNTGEVVAGDAAGGQGFATGDTVNIAARLEQAAAPGQVLIGETTYRLVRDAVEVEAVDPLELKGKAEPVPAWRLVTVMAAAPGLARRLDSPLVGRGQELETLERAFERAIAQRECRLVTVYGPAGAGKSRLTQEFLARVGGQATVLHGHCLPYGEAVTYWPIAEIVKARAGITDDDAPEAARATLASLLPEGAEEALAVDRLASAIGLTETPCRAEEIFSAVRRLFEHLAVERPLVVVFDDIHWAEPTFLGLIEYLVGWSRGAPILLVCPSRPELSGWMLGVENATSLALEPLGEAEAQRLIENLLGESGLVGDVAARVIEGAEGNPLFVEEMLRMLIDDGLLRRDNERWVPVRELSDLVVPPSVDALLSARLDRLIAEEREIAQRASVIGRVFWQGAVSELSREAVRPEVGSHLQTLAVKELVRPDPSTFVGEDAFRFSHILIRDAAYRSIVKELREDLHERFAHWLEVKVGERAREFEEILGYHYEQAFLYRTSLRPLDERAEDLRARATEWLGSAGRAAYGRGDLPAAANLLDRATRYLPPGHPVRLELRPALGSALLLLGELERADAVLSETIDEAISVGDRRQEFRARVGREFVRLQTDPSGRTEEILRVVDQAIPVFEQHGDELGLARAWRLRSEVDRLNLRYGEKAAALERALEHARRAADPREEANSLLWLGTSLCFGPTPVREAIPRCEAMLAAAAGSSWVEAGTLGMLAYLKAMHGEFDEARQLHDRSRRILEELGMKLSLAGKAQHAAVIEIHAADYEAAARELRQGYDTLAQMGENELRSTIAGYLADVLFELGRDEEAEVFARASKEAAAPDDLFSQVKWRSVRAKIVARRGEGAEAEALAREAVRLISVTDCLFDHGKALMDLAVVLQLSGRPADALAVLHDARLLFEQKDDRVSVGLTLELQAELEQLVRGAEREPA